MGIEPTVSGSKAPRLSPVQTPPLRWVMHTPDYSPEHNDRFRWMVGPHDGRCQRPHIHPTAVFRCGVGCVIGPCTDYLSTNNESFVWVCLRHRRTRHDLHMLPQHRFVDERSVMVTTHAHTSNRRASHGWFFRKCYISTDTSHRVAVA